MTRTTAITAAATALGALVAARVLPALDRARIDAAFHGLAGDTAIGARALSWEVSSRLHGLALPAPPSGTVTTAALALVLGLAAALAWHTWPAARRALRSVRTATGARPGPSRRGTRRIGPDVARARSLAGQGRLAIDVARETDLSRDAVDLIMRVPPDGIAGPGRSFRTRPQQRPDA